MCYYYRVLVNITTPFLNFDSNEKKKNEIKHPRGV